MENRVLRIKTIWRICTIAISIFMFMFFGSVVVFFFTVFDDFNWTKFFILFILICIILGFSIHAFLDTLYYRLIITTESIISKYYWGERVLPFKEIDYFWLTNDGYQILVIPKNKYYKKLKISTSVEDWNLLHSWLIANFRFEDLAAKVLDQEKIALLSNHQLGENTEERSNLLRKHRKNIQTLNVISFISGIWLMIYPDFNELLIFINLFLPVIYILYFFLSKGLVTPFITEGFRPSLSYAIGVNLSANLLVVFFNFNIYAYADLLNIFFVSVILILILLWRDSKYRPFQFNIRKDWILILYLLLITPLLMGWILSINYIFDKQKVEKYEVEILDKRMTESDNYDDFYFEVVPWATREENNEVSVPEYIYDESEIGEKIIIKLHPGFFNIPWYEITRRH